MRTPVSAAVFRADERGGALMLSLGPHRQALPLPAGLKPERALLAPLLAPSLSALMQTRARPGETVRIRGTGPVAVLAARLFTLAGYEVSDAACAGTVALVLDCADNKAPAFDAELLRTAMNCLVDEQQILVDEGLLEIVEGRVPR